MGTERAIAISNAALYAKDFEEDLIAVRMEQGSRKAIKVVPMPGSVLSELFSAHSTLLYDGVAADALDLTNLAYASKVTKDIDLAPFNAYGCTLTVVIQAKVTTGDTLYIRIKDVDGNVVGAEQTETLQAYTANTFTWTELNVGTDTMDIEAYVDGGQGSLYIDSITVSDSYARPVVENSGIAVTGPLTVALDTKGYAHLSYMYDTDDADAGDILFQISNDNATWKTHTTHTPGGAEVNAVTVATGFRYVRLYNDKNSTQTFWLSAKR